MREHWCKPLLGTIKCNVNGAIFVDNNATDWATIVRDAMGDFVRCIFGFSHGMLEPFMVEAIVARVLLSWLRSWHVDGVVLEIDNQQL
ncbi:hypothetical protein Golax_012216, partial [Gossypium laxum]|nr:hypothetical protein [Gossypium laxum]